MKLSILRLLVCALAVSPALRAQFSSGSTGSDGALNYPTAGSYTFDPQALGLNPAGDNVFNFTTINIAGNVTLNMPADVLRNKPVIWLATGAVTINGTLNLNGANGAAQSSSNPGATRSPAMPGTGGFPGGVGAWMTSPATNGDGYGGGTTTTTTGNSASYMYISNQLVPLVGGSGGAGGQVGGGTAGGNGGAGGGAIRIVSSTSITIGGSISAEGGNPACGVNGYCGGYGSAGAVHLIAPTVAMSGGIGAAIFKASANTFTNTGNIFATQNIGGLYNPPLPTGVPQVKVVSVNGAAAPADVTASVLAPDFTVTSTSAVSVNIAAQNIPVGTLVKLYLTSEQGNDSTVTCAALAGSLASSTATCTGANYPQGITITDIRAVW